MAKTDQEMLKAYKARIKRQNEKIKKDYDRVSATLPLGTINRIKALGLTINGVINDSVLAFLKCAEESAGEHIQITQDSEMGPEHTETRKPTNNPEKSEAEVDETHAEPLPNSEPCIENGFDGLKAAD